MTTAQRLEKISEILAGTPVYEIDAAMKVNWLEVCTVHLSMICKNQQKEIDACKQVIKELAQANYENIEDIKYLQKICKIDQI